MLTNSLTVTYLSLIWMLQLLSWRGRITPKQYYGWSSLLVACGGVMSAANHWTINVYLHAGITAWQVWKWWNNGGGDDTKRRLKSWAGRFEGVRRTAPSSV